MNVSPAKPINENNVVYLEVTSDHTIESGTFNRANTIERKHLISEKSRSERESEIMFGKQKSNYFFINVVIYVLRYYLCFYKRRFRLPRTPKTFMVFIVDIKVTIPIILVTINRTAT